MVNVAVLLVLEYWIALIDRVPVDGFVFSAFTTKHACNKGTVLHVREVKVVG